MNEQLGKLAVVAIVMLIVTALHVGWLVPIVSTPMPAMLLLLGVFASALHGGLWPGLLATAISVLVALVSSPDRASHDESLGITLLALVGIMTSLMAHAAHSARLRSDADRAALRRQMRERAEAEMRLASSEQRFRTVVDTLPDVVFTADAAGRLTVLNKSWLDRGPERPDDPRLDLFELVHPDDAARVRAAWRHAIDARAQLDLRCRLRARGKSYRWAIVRAQASAVPTQEPSQENTRWFGVVVDIDQAIAAERALRDSDERLQLALAATGLGSFEMDFTSGEQHFNETARRMLGLDADRVVTLDGFDARVDPRDLERMHAAIEKARGGGEGAQFDIEYRFRRPDDSWRWIAMRGKCFADPAAGPLAARCIGTLHDITDRRDAQRALADAAERLRLALEATDLGMWDYEFAADVVVCSDRIYAIAGLERGTPIDRGAWLALVVPDDVPALLQHARDAVAPVGSADAHADQRGSLDIEFRLQRASDAAVRWVALTGRVAFDAGWPEKPLRATGTLRDVTRRRETVERLRSGEERLALAQEAGHIGTFDWDLATDAFTCSATEGALLGLAPGAFPDTYAAVRRLIHPVDQHAVETTLEMALERQDSYADEFRIVRPDGAIRWLAARASITRADDGTPRRMIGVHRDVTDDKQAAQRLEASEERFRLATEALDGLIYDYDPIDDVVERSRGLYEITGWHVDEVAATGAWWRARIHPDDLARVGAAFDRAVTQGALRIEQDYRLRHRDGHWVYVNDRALLVWRNSIVRRMVGITTDVTERRRIERALRDADRRKDEFLAVLAHELRNPLAPIRNAVQVIGRASESPSVARAAAILERQVSQMVRLIEDLLDVSRIAHGRLKLRRQPTGLRAVLEGAIETVQPLLHEKRQLFEYRLPETDVTVDADGVRLTQVVANLLHNASKYTPQGGRVSLRADHEAGARTVEIRVRDTGIGIAAHTLESIFTMFSQVPPSDDGAGKTAGKQDGLGIGLALARAVITLHGGTIHATSDGIGRGSEFIVRLPTSTDNATAPQRVSADGQQRRVLRVLVVDDNRDSAESLASVLRLDRHEVFVAYGGREAVAVAERELPDLILLDIGMPDMDGYEVARVLRASEHHAAVRIVALSGYGQPGDRDKSFAAGCDGHLVKPVSAPDLAVWLRDPASDAVSSPIV